jgi:hypothetical protein
MEDFYGDGHLCCHEAGLVDSDGCQVLDLTPLAEIPAANSHLDLPVEWSGKERRSRK